MIIKYKTYFIEQNTRGPNTREWDWWADGYDGAEDAHDKRSGSCYSLVEAERAIEDNIIDHLETELIEIKKAMRELFCKFGGFYE